MTASRRHFLKIAFGTVTTAAAPALGHAQSYPSRPVKIIVPFGPGGPPDVIARLMAQRLSQETGQQFVIENLPGGGGNTGTVAAARAPADGYTLLAISGGFFVNPSFHARAPYDPANDFAPVSLVASTPNIIVVHPTFPAKTLREMIDLVKANPGKYSYGHASTGSMSHLSGELLKLRFGLDLVTVPFNAGPQAAASVIGGHTPIAFTSLPTMVPSVKEGKVRALAVTRPERTPTVPDVPTMAEAGAPDQEAETLLGLVAPTGTPPDIIAHLYREIVKATAHPEVHQRLTALGYEPLAMTPEVLAGKIKSEVEKWGKVIRDANIRIN